MKKSTVISLVMIAVCMVLVSTSAQAYTIDERTWPTASMTYNTFGPFAPTNWANIGTLAAGDWNNATIFDLSKIAPAPMGFLNTTLAQQTLG